ncbi:MAG: hypothetical protein J2P15_09605, partial [Micromonosporaceae bacterium]|nr:hypothetical protein [Micromonosporaceae bacterium]
PAPQSPAPQSPAPQYPAPQSPAPAPQPAQYPYPQPPGQLPPQYTYSQSLPGWDESGGAPQSAPPWDAMATQQAPGWQIPPAPQEPGWATTGYPTGAATSAPPAGQLPWARLDDPFAAPPITSAPPAPHRTALVVGLVIGIVVALLTGGAGFLVGHSTAGGAPKPATSASPPAPYGSLNPYVASQLALNKTKLGGQLAALAKPLLPFIGECVADTDTGGPKLQADETQHVFCRYGATSIHFTVYKAATDIDNERTYRRQLAAAAGNLAPGLAEPARKNGAQSKVLGNYIEYAWKAGDGQTWCGLWWDRDDGPLAALRMETLCADLGGSWAPLRDLWQRYS